MESTNSTKYLKGVIHINYHLVQKRKNDMVLESSLNNTYIRQFSFLFAVILIFAIFDMQNIFGIFAVKNFHRKELLPHIKK